MGVVVLQPDSDKQFGSFVFLDRISDRSAISWCDLGGGIEAVGGSYDWRKL